MILTDSRQIILTTTIYTFDFFWKGKNHFPDISNPRIVQLKIALMKMIRKKGECYKKNLFWYFIHHSSLIKIIIHIIDKELVI